MAKETVMEKNILLEKQYLKKNIEMVKEMEKKKNMMMVNQYMKENI